MIIGAHLSIAKGMPKALEHASAIDAGAFQFFTRNPRGGRARKIPSQEIEIFKQERQKHKVRYTLGHMPYTVNLAKNRADVYEFAKDTLLEDLERFDQADINHLVVHPGSHLGDGIEAGIERIVEALTYVFNRYQGKTHLLLETMSGHGTEIGSNIDELEKILAGTGWPDELGIGLDSCHLFAAGYNVASKAGLDSLAAEIEQKIGWQRVGMMHLNDSKEGLGSGIDRHAKIGEGKIGREGIKAIINHQAFRDLPFVLETPVDDFLEYGSEIRLVKELRQN